MSPGGCQSRPSVHPCFPEDAALVMNSAADGAFISGGLDQQYHHQHPHQQQQPFLTTKLDVPVLEGVSATTTSTATAAAAKKRRNVVFSDNLVQVETFQSWTVAEKSKVWWTQRELRDFTIDCKKTLRIIAEGGGGRGGRQRNDNRRDDDPDFCARGLEIRTKAGSARRLHIKEQARTAVMRAQSFQRREGFDDPMYLAELYARYARSCIQTARTRGIADEFSAQR